MASPYRAVHGLRKGQLHQALGEDGSKPIPQEKLDAALKSLNSHVRQMSELAFEFKKSKKS